MKVRLLVILLLCSSLAGCAPIAFGLGAAAGVAGYKFYEGSLIVVFRSPFMETWDATHAALSEMNYNIDRSEHDLTKGTVYAKRSDNQPVTISMAYKSAKETEVKIRVGHLGDEKGSMVIKEKIERVLYGG